MLTIWFLSCLWGNKSFLVWQHASIHSSLHATLSIGMSWIMDMLACRNECAHACGQTKKHLFFNFQIQVMLFQRRGRLHMYMYMHKSHINKNLLLILKIGHIWVCNGWGLNILASLHLHSQKTSRHQTRDLLAYHPFIIDMVACRDWCLHACCQIKHF